MHTCVRAVAVTSAHLVAWLAHVLLDRVWSPVADIKPSARQLQPPQQLSHQFSLISSCSGAFYVLYHVTHVRCKHTVMTLLFCHRREAAWGTAMQGLCESGAACMRMPLQTLPKPTKT